MFLKSELMNTELLLTVSPAFPLKQASLTNAAFKFSSELLYFLYSRLESISGRVHPSWSIRRSIRMPIAKCISVHAELRVNRYSSSKCSAGKQKLKKKQLKNKYKKRRQSWAKLWSQSQWSFSSTLLSEGNSCRRAWGLDKVEEEACTKLCVRNRAKHFEEC